MKILSLMLLRALSSEPEAISLASSYKLDDFNYFQREGVKQFATFISKTVAKRVELGQRSSVEHEGYHVHVHVRSNGLASVAVCDKEYPSRVAFTLLMKMQEDFINAHSEAKWMSTANELGFAPLDDMITKYQDPHEADAIMRIQKDLDETKIILHKTIDSVLERGVKLDNLVEKSTDLSAQSKMFYKTAKKQNSCCARGETYIHSSINFVKGIAWFSYYPRRNPARSSGCHSLAMFKNLWQRRGRIMPPLPLAVFDSDGGYSYPENSAGRPSPQQDIAVIANLQSYRLGQQNALALIACLARKRGFVDDSTAVFRRHPYLRDATSLLEIL